MHPRTTWLAAVVLGACLAPAWAGETPPPATSGLREIPDAELGAMRGRYIVGDNRVAWFGVTMVSTWLTGAGQSVQGAMQLGFDLRGRAPDVSFLPSVTITEQAASAVAVAAAGDRHVEAGGLANVAGAVQSVQVAGDGNVARNAMHLQVRDGVPGGDAVQGATATAAEATVGDAHARAALEAGGARVLLQVAGQGAAEQWIDARSIGQSIRLTGDAQAVGNRLQLDLVRQAAPASGAIHQNLVQAIGMTRAGGI